MDRRQNIGFLLVMVLFVGGILSLWSATPAQAAVITWDGGGTDGTCGGAGTANNWSCGANWSGDVAPGTGDIATFNATSTKNATINSNIDVQGIDINTGYSGTITQATGVTVTVGTGDFDISAGTFVGGDSTIDLNDAFTVSGGTFTATTGNMQLRGNFTVSSGSFDPSTGTIIADSNANGTWNVVTTETVNNLTVNKSAGTNMIITSGDTIVVVGTLTLTDGTLDTGTVDARGNIVQETGMSGGSATIDFGNDAVAQTYTINGGTGPGLRFDSAADASDSLTYAAAGDVGDLTITSGFSGTVPFSNPTDVDMTVQTWTQAAGTFNGGSFSDLFINGALTISGGTFNAPTTVTATSNSSATWNVNVTQTFQNLTIDKSFGVDVGISSGDTLVVTGTLSLSGTGGVNTGTIDARGNIVQEATFGGGSAVIDFGDDGVAQTYTINGGSGPGIRLDSAADASDSIVFAAAGNPGDIDITAGFSGTVPISNPSDFAMTVQTWTQAAGTFNGAAFSNMFINGSLTISGGTFNAPTTVTAATNTGTTWNINSTQAFTNLTLNKTFNVTVNITSGDTLVVNNTLTLTDGNVSTGTIEAMGNIVQASTYDGGTATIEFANDAAVQTYTLNGGTAPQIELDDPDDADDIIDFDAAATISTFDVTSGFSGAIPITNPSDFVVTITTWTHAAGTYDASAQSSWFLSNYTQTGGSFIAPTLVTVSGSGGNWDVPTSQTVNQLTINMSSGNDFLIASGDTVIATGLVTFTNGTIRTGTLELRGDMIQTSTADGGTGLITFGNDAAGQTYTINGGIGPTLELDDPDDANDLIDFDAAGTLTAFRTTSGFSGSIPLSNPSNFIPTIYSWSQAAGTYDASAQSQWILNDLDVTGGTFTAPVLINANLAVGNATWDVNGTQTIQSLTINKAGSQDIILSTNDTVILTGTLTLTAGVLGTNSGAVWEAQGNVSVASTWNGGSGTLRFGGSSNQTFTLTGATGLFNGDILVNKSGGQVNLGSALVMDASSQDLSIQEGVMDLVGHNVTVNGTSGTFVVEDGGILELFGAETITLNASNPTLQSGSTVRFTGDGDAAGDTYTVTTLKNAYHHLTINSTDGATDTFQLGSAIDLNGNFTVTAGAFDVSASNHAMTVAGDWSNSGSFNARAGTVTFDGASQTISGTTTFNHFGKTVASAATLTFPASVTQTFLGTMTLQGASASDRLAIRSSTPTTMAKIDPQSTRTVSYLDVQDNDNDNATAITCGTGCISSGNNENWNFPGIQVSGISGNTTEAGGTATFTVVLGSQPTGDVTVTLDTDDATEGTVDDTSLTFTNVNWATPQTITVTGQNDDVDDGDIAYTIVIDPATSSDGTYNGFDPPDVGVTNTDNDAVGVTVGAISGDTTEAGGTATFTVVLTSEPTGNVVINSVSSDSTEGTVTTGNPLTFTSGNWDTPQTVTVTGQDDALNDGDIGYTINVTVNAGSTADPLYDPINPNDVSVTNIDNENPGFSVSTISRNTTEGGQTATFTVVLSALPTGDVSFNLDSNDLTEGTVDQTSLTFTTGNWDTPQTVTVTGVNDFVDDGNIAYSIVLEPATSSDPDYNGVNPSDVAVTNVDNDTAGVTVGTISGNTTEGGGTATFTLVLTSQPLGDVEIDSVSNDSTEGVVTSNSTVTFTTGNWNTPQTVTVTGQDDVVSDGNIAYSVVTTIDAANTADAQYDAINPADVSVTNNDNDTAGVTVSAISGNTSEAGGTATFTVVLGTQPTGNVEIDSVSDDSTEGVVTSGGTLTFTTGNWDTPQTVTVTGQNDDVDDGNIAYTILVTVDTANTADAVYDAIEPNDVAVTNNDNDTSGATVSAISGNTTEGGGTATFTVVLTAEPTGDVEIDSVSNDSTEGVVTGGGTLTFTSANWDTPQTVTVTGQDDFADDGNVGYSIVVTVDAANTADALYDAVNPNDVSVTNTDDDTAGVDVSLISADTTEAGGTATFTVVLEALPSGNVEIDSVSSDLTEGVVTSGSSLTFTTANWDTPQTVTVTGQDDFVNDGNIGYIIFVTVDAGNTADPSYDALDPDDVSANNVDNDNSDVTITQSGGNTSVSEAGETSDTYTVVLDSQPTDTVTITVTDDADVDASPGILTFTTGNWDTPQTVTVTAIDDDLDETDPHAASVSHTIDSTDLTYDGLIIPAVSVNVTDNDVSAINVSAISGNTTEAGGTATFTVVLATEPVADVTITLDSNDLTEGTVDDTSLTFTSANWDTPQTITVTGEDDDIDDGTIAYDIVLAAATSADPTYNGLNPSDVDVNNTDNDTADMIVTESGGSTDVTEGGATDSYTIVLASEPTDDVVITVTPDAQVDVSAFTLTFTSANWDTPQTVTVTAEDDSTDESATHPGTITHSVASDDGVYDGFVVDDVVATITDDDTSGGGGSGSPTPAVPPALTPSHLSIVIEDGAARTRDASVMVTVSAENANAYQLSNTSGFTGAVWVSFDGEADNAWTLSRDVGLATVYARFRSADGIISSEVSDTIEVDPTANDDELMEEEEEEEEPVEEEEPTEETPEEPPAPQPTDEEQITAFVRTETDPTVFATLGDGTMRVIPNMPTLLTYIDGCNEIEIVSDDVLSQYPLSGSVWVNSGRTLVKFPDQPAVYVVEDDVHDPWKRVLRWIVSEEVAELNFGEQWTSYVIDVAAGDWYTLGDPIDGLEYAGEITQLRSRAALNSAVEYELSIVLPDGTRRDGFGPYAKVETVWDGVRSFSFEDREDGDFNDVVLQLDPTNCLTFDVSALPQDSVMQHEVWLSIYWDGVKQGEVQVFQDSHDGVETTATVDVANHTQFKVEMIQQYVARAPGLISRAFNWVGSLFR